MSIFSKKFSKLIEDSGRGNIPFGISCDPSFYSGRGVRASDLNSKVLEALYKNIGREYGKNAAQNFVALVAQVTELSAANFLMALGQFERAGFEWNPEKHASQANFCITGGERRDLTADTESAAHATVLDGLSGRGNSQMSRTFIAGDFLEKYGSREQVKGLRDDDSASTNARGSNPSRLML
jgi:hypothetical protein